MIPTVGMTLLFLLETALEWIAGKHGGTWASCVAL
jgi:hypothetical protein